MARYTKQSISSIAGINSELTKIQTAIADTLSRKGDTSNQMQGTLDMNSNRVLNLPEPIADHEPVPAGSIQKFVDRAAGVNIVQESQPTVGLRQGIRWYKPSEATTYVYFCDGDSCQWVQEPIAGSGSLSLALESKTPEDYGAVGDAVMVDGIVSGSDDTLAIQAWLDDGGPYALRRKANYRLTAEINMPENPVTIVGLGRLPVYPYFFPNYGASGNLPTFLIDHNGSDGFRFTQNSSARGSLLYGFNVIRATDSSCIRAFGFDVTGSAEIPQNYGYDTTFDRVGIFDFVSAVDLYDSSGVAVEPTMADITIRDCAINRNGWISRTLNGTAWNGFKFHDNKAGQQTTGGIDVQAHNFLEKGNFLEGMPNPIRVRGAYKGFVAEGSYFEANAQPGGVYLYKLESLRGPARLGAFSIVASNEGIIPVICSNVSNLESEYPTVAENCYNVESPRISGTINKIPEVDPLSLGISSVDTPSAVMTVTPNLIKSSGLYRATANQERGINPFTGKAMVIEGLDTLVSSTDRTVSLAADTFDYVVLSFMLRHTSGTQAETYITVDINGVSALGSRDYSFTEEALYLNQAGWKCYTVVVKAQVPVASVVLRVYPYGVGAASGLPFELSGITAYSTDTVNSVGAWINESALSSVSAIPSTGSWLVGDCFKNTSPTAVGEGAFLFSTTGWVYS